MVSVRQTPIIISSIAGDILQNLRSSLDHLAYQLFLVGPGGQAGQSGYHIYFPIYDDASEYKAKRGGKIKGLGQNAIDAIDATKPYKGGNDALWRLHKLNNIDKHRRLTTVGSSFRSVNVGPLIHRSLQQGLAALAANPEAATEFRDLPMVDLFLRPAERLCPLKVGDELFIDVADAEVNEKMQFRFDTAFSEPGILESEPLIETLQHMADLVYNLVSSFKSLL